MRSARGTSVADREAATVIGGLSAIRAALG